MCEKSSFPAKNSTFFVIVEDKDIGLSNCELLSTSAEQNLQPRVTIGIPVLNGAPFIERAIQSIVSQTYANLEIIISDNCSTDATADICRKFASQDDRIKYIRQDDRLPAMQNFRFTLECATGDYFSWAAHDDWRLENYVATVVQGLIDNPEAVLGFSDIALIDPDDSGDIARRELRRDSRCTAFDTRGLSYREKVIQQVWSTGAHVYGVYRTSVLRQYPWYETDWAPDFLLTLWLLSFGDLIHISGTVFFFDSREKTNQDRSRTLVFRDVSRWYLFSHYRSCLRALIDGEKRQQRHASLFILVQFSVAYFKANGQSTVNMFRANFYGPLPDWTKNIWRAARRRLGR